ncbi:MAG: amidohydrolase family protein [Peptostreptococcaceae bacterium]
MTELIQGNIIFTKSSKEFIVIEDGFIEIEDGKVKNVFDILPNQYAGKNITDYKGKLIIPGMNDLHCHAAQFRNMGMSMGKELIPWLNDCTFPEECKYEDLEYATKMYKKFITEIWRCGTTRVVAFATIHKDSTSSLIDLFIKSGLGAYIGKVNMDRNCHNGLIESTNQSILDTENLILKYKDASPIVKPIITPRFIPTCSDKLLKGLGELSINYDVPVQSHMSENCGEIDWVKELHPQSDFYGQAYNNYNLFGQRPTLMAHCVYSSTKEIDLMKKNNVMAVHCPDSNLNLGSGVMPLRKFLDNNVNIGLGSDISGGHNLSIFNTIVSTIQSSKLWWVNSNKKYDFLSLSEAFYLATKGGGLFFGKVGSFEKDYDFDALIIDDENLNHDNYSLLERLERFIYLGDDRNIIHRYVCGKIVKEPNFL